MTARPQHMQTVLGELLARLTPLLRPSPPGLAMYCQAHDDEHVRGGEAAYPLVAHGLATNSPEMVKQGLGLAEWLCSRQSADGSWPETPGTWVGTSVFQLMALAGLLLAEPPLTDARRRTIEAAVREGADWTARCISFRAVTTNYVASGGAGLALAARALQDPDLTRHARRLVRASAGRLNADGLVEGEGRLRRVLRKIVLKPKGIDIGYNLEMTLGSWAVYLAMQDDERVATALRKGLEAHLWFVNNDGSLDNAMGSRCYKWTVYGSKTAHGMAMALTWGARHGVPGAAQALDLHLDYLLGLVRDGLLVDGPDRAAQLGPPCPYATLTRACALAFALKVLGGAGIVPSAQSEADPAGLPGARPEASRRFSSLNSAVLRRAPWRASVSGYGEMFRYPTPDGQRLLKVPAGGATTCLYLDGWGLVQAASQLDYQVVEMLHVPKASGPVPSLTPRAEIVRNGARAGSAWDGQPCIETITEAGASMARASGRLTSLNLERGQDGFASELRLEPGRVVKRMRVDVSAPCEEVVVLEPIILPPDFDEGCEVVHDADGLRLVRESGELRVRAVAGDWRFGSLDDLLVCPMPALRALAVACRWQDVSPGTLEAGLEIVFTPAGDRA